MVRASRAKAPSKPIRYQDHLAYEWLWNSAPCRWHGKVNLQFWEVEFASLEPAGSWKHPATVEHWLARLESGAPVAPPVVCVTERSTLYLHDGNHRYDAMLGYFGDEAAKRARVRVAVLVPQPGFRFQLRRYGTYHTYVLVNDVQQPVVQAPAALARAEWAMSAGAAG